MQCILPVRRDDQRNFVRINPLNRNPGLSERAAETAHSAKCRREEALGLVFMRMLEQGGLGEVATLGVAMAEAGGITLACDAKRALLRCQEASHAPMGRVCIEVIR